MEKIGLSEKEAEKKLKQYGLNEIKEILPVSPLQILLRQVKKNFVVYLLVTAVIISFLVGKNITAYTISFVIILVIGIGFIQEYKAEKSIQSLKKILMPISIVIREGKEKEILSTKIVPGDIIVLRSGEKIPADCFLLEEKELLVNESILTGESSEVKKKVFETEKQTDENMLFMGTFIVNGRCIAKVIHTGMNTKFGKISRMISTAEKELPLQNKVNKISKYMTIVAVVFSVLTGIVMLLNNGDLPTIEIFIVIIALMVSAFPEGFPVVLITTLSYGAYRMAQKNAIVNRISIIETLGETTVICSDKTGTITKGEMTVSRIFADNSFFEVTGVGYEAEGIFKSENRKIDIKKETVLDLLINSSVLCNDSRIERTGEDKIYHIIGSPTEASLLVMAAKADIFKEDLKSKRIQEIPFNSERKIMSVLCDYNNKKYVFSKGALEYLIKKCKFTQRNNGIFTLTQKEKERIVNANKKMTKSSLRTIALAYKNVKTFSKDHFEDDLIFLGLIGMEDPPREEVKRAIKTCFKAGIKVKMITGDNRETAMSIAEKIGLFGKIIEGHELDEMDDKEFEKIINSISVFARVKPEHKIRIVRALKSQGEIVTMTGDGVNDAPALKEAHIGVAMGIGGTDVSRSVADLTLKDNNFTTIVTAIREGRTIFKNIRKFVSYQLSCNYAELAIIFIGVLLSPILGWQVPLLLALQILFMNLVTDDFPAITLALTPSSDDIMYEKPRKKEGILHRHLLIWTITSGVAMAILTLLSYYISFNVLHQSIEVARTTALLSLILVEIANAFNFMSFRREVFPKSFLANKYLLGASIISLIATLIIIYTPARIIFETTPVGFENWGIAISGAFLVIFIFNLLKFFNNKKKFLNLDNSH